MLVLGEGVPRGSVVKATPIGVIRLLDRGEQDDKILAVLPGSVFEDIKDADDLTARFPGAAEAIVLWWTNAHGKSMNVLGIGSRGQANAVIDYAADAYSAAP